MRRIASPPFFSPVAQRYGSVILSFSQTVRQRIMEDMALLIQWSATQPMLWGLCKAIGSSYLICQASLEAFYKDIDISPEGKNLFDLLTKNKRLKYVEEISSYILFILKNQERETVYLTTAFALSKKQIHTIQEYFLKRWTLEVDIQQAVDPELLLGGILIWRGMITDLCLQTLLKHAQQRIIDELCQTAAL